MRSTLIFMFMVALFVGCSDVNNPTAPTSAKTPFVKGSTWDRVAATPNYYQDWTAGGGTLNASNLGSGHFSCSWSGVSDIVVGSGFSPMPSGQSMTWSGSESGANYFGVYGWMTSPLTEYYIGRGGGTSVGSYSVSTGSYTLQTVSCNGANINGNGPFQQFNASGNGGSGIVPSDHWSKWGSLGHSVSGANYCIVSVEAWVGAAATLT